MRIALVAPFGLRTRGTTRARMLPLARALAARQHAVALFIPPYDSPADSGRRWHEDGVYINNVILPTHGLDSASWHLHLAERLLRAVHEWQADVMHVFKPKGPSGLVGAAMWALRRPTRGNGRSMQRHAPRSPSIILDCDDWEGPGGWNDDPRTGYSAVQRRFFAWQEKIGFLHSDAWTVTSVCLRERTISFGAAPERVFILHNGISASAIRPPASEPYCDVPITRAQSAVLYTRFAGVRVADVAHIWLAVCDQLGDAWLTVVGCGLRGEESQLADLPRVNMLGWVEPQQLPELFGRMAVAMVPWNDTPVNRARHSAKVLELMAAGLPVVAYAVGELPTTVGEAGILVPPGDDRAFAAAVVEFLRDRERARLLGAAARARVLDNFAWESLVDVALAAYEAAIGS
jgi:glycosyltransferase involved in cell wall biosynthesis